MQTLESFRVKSKGNASCNEKSSSALGITLPDAVDSEGVVVVIHQKREHDRLPYYHYSADNRLNHSDRAKS